MIRFRNPGTQYTTQVQVFKELYKNYKDLASFDLDDMSQAITRTNLMTAYGYAGDAALALSNTENDSLNSTKMNVKMYAEVYRLLGWASSAGRRSYPLRFTYIGRHVAEADDRDILGLYEQCVLGINNPQEIMRVHYTEKLRFFKTVLLTLQDMDGIMYKHELCYGPMSVDDLDPEQYADMISRLKSVRGSHDRLCTVYDDLCAELSVQPDLPDNCTRLPIGFMKTCGWVSDRRTSALFPPKSLLCIKLTEHGEEVANEFKTLKDLRLDEFRSYDKSTQQALIRLGVYTMLERAGYDVAPVQETIDQDTALCAEILQGKKLLFSPYQTIKAAEVDEALGIEHDATGVRTETVNIPNMQRTASLVRRIELTAGTGDENTADDEVTRFREKILRDNQNGSDIIALAQNVFEEMVTATQTTFYPFVAMLFRVLGFDCQASRPGDNGARWDAIIVDETDSIPIEIKSPTEEQHISLKAIRQALENKVILLSRETHPTRQETTSLVVGYNLPNDRAEVTNLLMDFKSVYGVSIGVIDLMTLLKAAISHIVNGSIFDHSLLNELEGFADVAVE